MQGSSLRIYVIPMHCSGCGYNFIDNEMWLEQGFSYWVEAGYIDDGHTGEYYFWADKRPVDGVFYQHPMGVIPGADYYTYTTFSISRVVGVGNRYLVAESGWSTSWTGYSSANSMIIDNVEMGMELSGSSGAGTTNYAYYDSRQYRNDSLVWKSLPAYSGNYYAQDPPTHIVQSGTNFYTYCVC